MRVARAILVVVALIIVAGRYLHERRALAVIQQLPGERARDHYEAARKGTDTVLYVMTALFTGGAVAALIYYWLHAPPQGPVG